MENWSYVFYTIAAIFFCFSIYHLLKLILKFGKPYDDLRAKMELLREEISKTEPPKEVIESFNRNAKSLKIPPYIIK